MHKNWHLLVAFATYTIFLAFNKQSVTDFLFLKIIWNRYYDKSFHDDEDYFEHFSEMVFKKTNVIEIRR